MAEENNMETLNLLGKPCPIPVIEAKKALRDAEPGRTITLLVDNDIARQNLEKMAYGLGRTFKFEPGADGGILVTITCGQTKKTGGDGGGLVVAIGHEGLGGGPGEDLGKTLMKSFIYSLTELETAPEYILFFNGGAFLTSEGSNALSDLKTLEDQGALINTCGACLNYYRLAEKLKIGSVTNMYAIAATLAQARKVISF
jgi:selenium metabolism protein YedF